MDPGKNGSTGLAKTLTREFQALRGFRSIITTPVAVIQAPKHSQRMGGMQNVLPSYNFGPHWDLGVPASRLAAADSQRLSRLAIC